MIVARRRNAKFIRSPRPYIKNILKYVASDWNVSTAPSAYIQYLREHRFVITGRYHTVSMCIKNKIPFIAIDSNTPKIRYLLNDAIGETQRNIQITELNQINVSESYDYSAVELEKMNQFLENAEIMIDEMIFHIVNDMKNKQSEKYCYK